MMKKKNCINYGVALGLLVASFFVFKKKTFHNNTEGLYYYSKQTKIPLQSTNNSVFIETNLKGKEYIETLVNRTEQLTIVEEKKDLIDNRINKEVFSKDQHFFLEVSSVNEDHVAALNFIEKIQQNPNVFSANTGFKAGESTFHISSNFLVKLKSNNDLEVLKNTANKYGVQIKGQHKFMPQWYTLSVVNNGQQNAIEMANIFHETRLFDCAEPQIFNHLKTAGVDPLFNKQWGLRNTNNNLGKAGFDIKANQAWRITKGSEDVTIAVFDGGVYTDVVEVENSVLDSGISVNEFDFEFPRPTIDNHNLPGQYIVDNHGIFVTGIISAQHNNDIGIRGIAPECKILPISIAIGNTSADAVAFGINWAVAQGADVVNMSWEVSRLLPTFNSQVVIDAFKNGVQNGRNGKGTVFVISTGNTNSEIEGTLFEEVPDLILVGAITPDGKRKVPTDEYSLIDVNFDGNVDAFDRWGSNYGTPLDIMAPGVQIYSTAVDDFEPFNGTSFAAPMVSATAGLMLSVNPDLNVRKVHQLLMRSARKIRRNKYTYAVDRSTNSRRRGGIWNKEVGHGLLNAFQAVDRAKALASNSSSKLIEETELNTAYKFYPSPANENLYVSGNNEEVVTLNLFNLSGVMVKQITTQIKGAYQMNVSDLSNGIYLLQLNNSEGNELQQTKVIIQH